MNIKGKGGRKNALSSERHLTIFYYIRSPGTKESPKRKYKSSRSSKKIRAGERVFFFLSRAGDMKASVTLEAAWLSVLYLTLVLFLFSLFEVFYLENRLQAVMERLGAQSVMMGALKEELPEQIIPDGEVYSLLGDLVFSGMGAAVIEERLEAEMADLLSGGFCKAGHFQVDSLPLYREKEIVDLVVFYELELPVVGKRTRMLRSRKRLWSGNMPAEETGQIVYITMTGSVYHLYEDCTHLKLSIRQASRDQLMTLRSEGGGRYAPCELCIGQEEVPFYGYITAEGSRYHKSQACSGLKRSVLAIDISQVGERPLCRRCAGREGS